MYRNSFSLGFKKAEHCILAVIALDDLCMAYDADGGHELIVALRLAFEYRASVGGVYDLQLHHAYVQA